MKKHVMDFPNQISNKSLAYMINKFLSLALIFTFIWGSTSAQVNCTQELNSAEDLFEEGNLLPIPGKLNRCVSRDAFSAEEKIRAHRLLTLVYIYTDNEALAEQSLINLLKSDPEHPLDQNDPAELKYLYDKFKSTPIFRVGLKLGANQTAVNSFETFGTFNTGDSARSLDGKTYSAKVGIGLEATFEYQLPYGLEGILGVGYATQSYTVNNQPYADNFVVELTESQSLIKVPIMLRYKFQLNNIHPYVYIGGTFDYLLSSSISGSRQGGQLATITSIDMLGEEIREQINQSIIGGIGVKIRSKTNFIVVEARYSQGLNNVVQSLNRYANQELVFRGGHVDDNFAVNNLSLSFGYIKSIYNPKKYSEKKLAKRTRKKDIQ